METRYEITAVRYTGEYDADGMPVEADRQTSIQVLEAATVTEAADKMDELLKSRSGIALLGEGWQVLRARRA